MALFTGGAGADTFAGTDESDTVSGGAGNDQLSGGGGNDLLYSSPDPDVLNGGAGDDTFKILQASLVIGGSGRDTFQFGGDIVTNWAQFPIRYDTGAGTVITDFQAGAGGDIIDLTGMFTTIQRVPIARYDTIATDPFATGAARLMDTAGGVQIQLWEGSWRIMAQLNGVRASELTPDNFKAGTSVTHVLVDGWAGPDTVTTSVPIVPRIGVAGQTIDGTSGGETLSGGEGPDSMRGFDGNDSVLGGGGDDDVNGNMGIDTVSGGDGADWVRGGQGNDWVRGGDGNDSHVNGNLGDDDVAGDAGNDTVYGGQGSDTLWGGSGDDLLSGDLGNDILIGEAGADRFSFGPTGGRDWINDFNGGQGDRIVLPTGTAYTATNVNGEVVIELAGGAGIGLTGVSLSVFSASYVIFS